jgi:hypothetical protein
MNILILSNCQGDAVLKYLEQKLPANYRKFHIYKWDGNGITDEILNFLKIIDVLIFTFLSKKFEYYSTDPNTKINIFNYINKDCIKIGFGSIFQTAFWPVIPDFSCKGKDDGHNVIIELKKKYSINEILSKFDDNKINFNLQERFNKCEKHTKNIEEYYIKYPDLNIISVTDFIRKNYKEHKLFITHNHPCSYIIIYIVNKIIEILNNKKNLNISQFDNIFQYPAGLHVVGGNWLDSKYIKKELCINYKIIANEKYYKDFIRTIYNHY